MKFRQVSGFILAGGESSRMGRTKALLELGGVKLLVRAAQLLEPLLGSPLVIGSPALEEAFGLHLIPDDRAGLGPLGGISTALRHSENPWNLVIACDLPYLTAAWLEYLIERGLASTAMALFPAGQSGLEPLCAMYHKQAGPSIAAALESGVRKITDGLAGLAVETIPASEWKAFDSSGRLFKNMNSPADYEEAQAAFRRSAAG